MIAIGLIGGSEQFGSILQFSGLISVLGLLKKKIRIQKTLLFIFRNSNINIFISTIKPQLLHIASNSLVFCLIFFSDNNKKELLRKNFAICFLFLFSSALSKFSFFLSLSLLCIFIFYKSYKYKIFFITFLISICCFCLTLLPFLIWKTLTYETNLLNLLLNPFPIDDDLGLYRFKQYLINAGRGDNILSGVIFPDGLNNLSNALGIGGFYIFCYSKKFKKYIKEIMLITSFVFLGLFWVNPLQDFF